MSVDIHFYTIAERRPKHQEKIIWLSEVNSFHLTGFDPREIEVEYQWTEIDDEGYETGGAISYNGYDLIGNFRLDIMFDGYIVQDKTLWCPVKEYWKSFENHLKGV